MEGKPSRQDTDPKDSQTDAERRARDEKGDERQVQDAKNKGRVEGAW